MIDAATEQIVTFSQAADELPRRRRGRKTHVSTFFRWSTAGCRGVVLETIQIGGTRCTSRQALQRFFERLSEKRPTSGLARARGIRTSTRRKRESDQAGRLLEQSGA
jgi:hypothetical protein